MAFKLFQTARRWEGYSLGVVVRPVMPNGLYKFGTGLYDIFDYSNERLTPTDQE